jgi:hypothetical protein
LAAEWEAILIATVAHRMRQVGVPESMIGISGMLYEDPGAFVRTHAVGGSNNNQWSGKGLKNSRKLGCLQRLVFKPFSRGARPQCLHANLGRNLKIHRPFSPLPDR